MAHFAKLDENNIVLQVVVVNDLYEAEEVFTMLQIQIHQMGVRHSARIMLV